MTLYKLTTGPFTGRYALLLTDADGQVPAVAGQVCWYVIGEDSGWWGKPEDGTPVQDYVPPR